MDQPCLHHIASPVFYKCYVGISKLRGPLEEPFQTGIIVLGFVLGPPTCGNLQVEFLRFLWEVSSAGFQDGGAKAFRCRREF